MFGIPRANLEEVTVITRDVMHFEDFRDARQLVGRGHVRTMLGGSHGDKSQHAPIDHVRVDQRDVILDNALGFQFSKTLEDGRRCQPDGLGKLRLSRSGVVLKNIQN